MSAFSHAKNESIAAQAAALDDQDIWLDPALTAATAAAAATEALAPLLHQLDESFRCQICADLFRAPVSVIPCGHVFCSACVRRKLTTNRRPGSGPNAQPSCPSCARPVDVSGLEFRKCLVPNRAVDAAVAHWRVLRMPLKERLVVGSVVTAQREQPWSATTTPATGRTPRHTAAGRVRRSSRRSPRSRMDGGSSEASSESLTTEARQRLPPSQVSQPQLSPPPSQLSPPPSPSRPTAHTVLPPTTAVLPLGPPPISRLTKRPRASYQSKKKRQLQDLCRNEGLSTHGTDLQLRHRHEDYILLHNAECDSDRPRSVAELRREIHARERHRDGAARCGVPSASSHSRTSFAQCVQTLYRERERLGKAPATTTTWKSVPTGCAAFDEELERNFATLVQQLRDRQAKPKKNGAHTTVATTTSRSEGKTATNSAAAIRNPYATSSPTKKAEATHTMARANAVKIQGLATSSGDRSGARAAAPHIAADQPSHTRTVPSAIPTVPHTSRVSESPESTAVDSCTNRLPTAGTKRKSPLSQSQLNVGIVARPPPPSSSSSSSSRGSPAVSASRSRHEPPRKKTRPRISGPWTCTACTFYNQLNKSERAQCQVCATPRPTVVTATRTTTTPIDVDGATYHKASS